MPIKLHLDPEESARVQYKARRLAEAKSSVSIYSKHPWAFLRDCVYTLDQATSQIRKYPNDKHEPNLTCTCGGCTSYLHHVVNVWNSSRILVIPKSRRMIMSWTLVACHYWLARFRPGTTVAFVSRKQGSNDSEGSAELVKRARFIHDHLPDEIPKIPITYSWCRFTIHSDPPSEIIGIGQGADQLRQLTVSAILADEMAFWEEAQATYIASLPTTEGGGKFTGVSSANPGFFRLLCYDGLDLA